MPFVDIEREIDQPKSLVKLSVQMLSFVKVSVHSVHHKKGKVYKLYTIKKGMIHGSTVVAADLKQRRK